MMREYVIKGQKNYVYEYVDEIPVGLPINSDWRSSGIGEWVTADDGCVIQILRAGEMLHRKKKVRYVGTCTGTFILLVDTAIISIQLRNVRTLLPKKPCLQNTWRMGYLHKKRI